MIETPDPPRFRIAHVISGLRTGGAERALCNLLRGGLAGRFESLVVSLGDEGTMGGVVREAGAGLATLDMQASHDIARAVPKLRRIVREFSPQLIQGWMYHGNLAATVARRFVRTWVPLAWNVRQTLYDIGREKRMTRLTIRANRLLSAKPDVILYNSRLSKQQHEAFGFSDERSRVIPNGIDLSAFAPSADVRRQKRRELGLPPDALVVGHVARLHPMKNHAAFLRAAQQLADLFPQARFVLVGKDVTPGQLGLVASSNGPWFERLVALGERRDVPALLNAMDILCLSSAWGEGFPNVLGEAMACGVPCVATDIGDSSLVIGDAGIVVEPGNDDALTAGLRTLLEMKPADRDALALSATQRIRNCFSLESIVDDYASLYDSMLSADGAH